MIEAAPIEGQPAIPITAAGIVGICEATGTVTTSGAWSRTAKTIGTSAPDQDLDMACAASSSA